MFNPSKLEAIPKKYETLMRQLEQDIINDIVRRIKINGEITRSADYQISRLTEIGSNTEYIKKRIQETLNLSNAEIDDLYSKILKEEYLRDAKAYEKLGIQIVPFDDNLELQQTINAVINQTKQELFNITQTTGFQLNLNGKMIFTPAHEILGNVLDRGMMAVTQGMMSYDEVIRKAVHEMVASGFQSVDYASGYHRNVISSVRNCVMTGFNQVVGKVNEMNAEELGTEYFEVSWHANARPEHAVWQGKVYTKEQLHTVCGLGTGPGLLGWNCYHSYTPFILGVSERTYSDEWLEDQRRKESETHEWNGKKYTVYEATQKMRKLEDCMRKQREELKILKSNGMDNDDYYTNLKCKYRNFSSQYKQFATTMGLPQERQRIYVDQLGRA